MAVSPPLKGTIKMFQAGRGYGFIVPDDGGPDVFLHIRECKTGGIEEPACGMRVRYELKEKNRLAKGPRAAFVWRVEHE